MTHRFGPGGLYLLDEPEAALSVQGCLALVVRIADLVEQGSQFVVATHSPILLAVPGARILQAPATGMVNQVGEIRVQRRLATDELHHLHTQVRGLVQHPQPVRPAHRAVSA